MVVPTECILSAGSPGIHVQQVAIETPTRRCRPKALYAVVEARGPNAQYILEPELPEHVYHKVGRGIVEEILGIGLVDCERRQNHGRQQRIGAGCVAGTTTLDSWSSLAACLLDLAPWWMDRVWSGGTRNAAQERGGEIAATVRLSS